MYVPVNKINIMCVGGSKHSIVVHSNEVEGRCAQPIPSRERRGGGDLWGSAGADARNLAAA